MKNMNKNYFNFQKKECILTMLLIMPEIIIKLIVRKTFFINIWAINERKMGSDGIKGSEATFFEN